ncbi:hypothetical protein BHE74_00032969 [Ensete ventricosum]|nr:hypothetical protein BHE74_00032969 [Ensete ventricosum]
MVLLYATLVLRFWGVPVAAVPHHLLQPFESSLGVGNDLIFSCNCYLVARGGVGREGQRLLRQPGEEQGAARRGSDGRRGPTAMEEEGSGEEGRLQQWVAAAAREEKRAGWRQEQVRQRRLRQREEKAEEIEAAVKKPLGRGGSGQWRVAAAADRYVQRLAAAADRLRSSRGGRWRLQRRVRLRLRLRRKATMARRGRRVEIRHWRQRRRCWLCVIEVWPVVVETAKEVEEGSGVLQRRMETEVTGGGRSGRGRGQRRREVVVGGDGEADAALAGGSEEDQLEAAMAASAVALKASSVKE